MLMISRSSFSKANMKDKSAPTQFKPTILYAYLIGGNMVSYDVSNKRLKYKIKKGRLYRGFKKLGEIEYIISMEA